MPPERVPGEGVVLTEKFTAPTASEAAISAASEAAIENTWPDRPWWEYYEYADLNTLINTALIENPDLNQTRKRLEQAAAAARISMADLLPDIAVSGERSTSNGDNETPSSFSLRGAASYELDIWGGNRASLRASALQAYAAAEDIRTASITLSASIVESWLSLLALREEEALLKTQLETNDLILDLQFRRYENGVAQALDVLQQSGVLQRAKAQLPDVQLQQNLTHSQLALLAGQNPSLPLSIEGNALPETLPLPETGIPARLLSARPDITAAWLRLRSSDWATEAARVNRLPQFDISATFATNDPKFMGLFEEWALELALGLIAPVFDGGARAAEQRRQQAIADERFQAYRETVLAAIGEVEDALSRNHYQYQEIVALEEQLRIARSTLEQAQISYSGGNTDYISVLDSLINVQSLEQQLVREKLNLALARVGLYRALGLRTWADDMITGAETKT